MRSAEAEEAQQAVQETRVALDEAQEQLTNTTAQLQDRHADLPPNPSPTIPHSDSSFSLCCLCVPPAVPRPVV